MEAERADPPARRTVAEEPAPRAAVPFAREESASVVEKPQSAPARHAHSNACDWASVQAAAAESRRQVKMVIEEATLVEFKDGCVNLKVAPDLMTAAAGVQEDIRQLIARAWGRTVRLEFTQPAAPVATAPGDAGARNGTQTPEPEAPAHGPSMTVANATENPLIAKAVELFGAKVLGVYPRQK